jgi:GNAT superfamily N-acetyltransferase
MNAEAFPEDPPTPLELSRHFYRNIPSFQRPREFVARGDDGRIVGFAGTYWWDQPENRHILRAYVGVLVSHRRQGVGRALLASIVRSADDADRTLLMGGTIDRVPDGGAFLRRIEAQPGLEAHVNRLLISDVDRNMVRRWVDEGPGRAPGYSLLLNVGRYPDEIVEQVADVYGVMNTAPRGDLDAEDERTTVEELRQMEDAMLPSGLERWSYFARHDATGEIVGWSEVGWRPTQPDTVYQWGTGVKPAHQGHALGKWMKAAMLEKVMDERPNVTDIRTGNADSNAPMLGINKALGFQHWIAEITWQIPVAKVREYLGAKV